jgi:NAD(P)H-hydrate epimerase
MFKKVNNKRAVKKLGAKFKLTGIPNALKRQYGSLSIDDFVEMDNLAINKYNLTIEVMMENAGLQLARLTSLHFPDKNSTILVGAGPGNNGGGGLVAARRLAGWGYKVYLHIPEPNLRALPALQLERALSFGAKQETVSNPDVFIDAYLGFSQRLPLSWKYKRAVVMANAMSSFKISLDLPTGFQRKTGCSLFKPKIIMTLAAPKKELLKPGGVLADIYVADIGIPSAIYNDFGIQQPDFNINGLVKLKN